MTGQPSSLAPDGCGRYKPSMKRTSTQVIGLTGGIASGKSTVAARWRKLGVEVIDADLVAREIVEPGKPALSAIAKTFGDTFLQADGTLNRGKLGAYVFSDPAALARLNALTHPAIMAAVGKRMADAHRAGSPWVAYEAALILENQLAPGLTELVAVICAPETQVQRVMTRNGLDETQARQRVASQTDNATRLAAADHVIENDGSLVELLVAADALFGALCERHGPIETPLAAGPPEAQTVKPR